MKTPSRHFCTLPNHPRSSFRHSCERENPALKIFKTIIAVLLIFITSTVRADIFSFGGPSSVSEELRLSKELINRQYRYHYIKRSLRPWFEFKYNLLEKYSFNFAVEYLSLYQAASNSLHQSQAAGGVARTYGRWRVFQSQNDSTGSIVFKFENRHRHAGKIAPTDFGFNAGAQAITGNDFSSIGWAVTNLYWHQKSEEGRFGFILGVIDVTDYYDVYPLVNPLTAFSNLAFQNSPAIAIPNQGLGIAGAAYLTQNIYFIAGLADANGEPDDLNFKVFEDFETFKHAEIGWTSTPERIYLDNIHLCLWQVDQRKAANIPRDYGAAFSVSWTFDESWVPFFRSGWSKGDAALLAQSLSVGLGHFSQHRDLFAFGLNWGKPGNPDYRRQILMESFYRFQFSQNFSITADIQYIVHPARNPDASHIFLMGVRGSFTI